MKRTLLLSGLLLSIITLTKAEIYFRPDFKSAQDWNQFTLYDLDGRKPQYTNWGTKAPYYAWVRMQYDANTVLAASTSYYTPAGAANDWMVSPAIAIPAGDANAKLIWDAINYDREFRDGYKVYISTTGNKVENFTSVPVFSIEEEDANDLHRREISLSDYAGQTIYIAWVNDSNDKFVLMIGNIVVYSNETEFSATIDYPPYLSTETEYAVSGTIKNELDPINSFTVHYTAKGETHSQTFNTNVASNASYNFRLNDKIAIAEGEAVPFEVWITTPDFETAKQSRIVSRITSSEKYSRKVVGEEGTGTWCGWCPRGAVYMALMREKYPETFIGIAVHNDDPMTVTEYDAGMRTLISGYPSGVINRTMVVDPGDFEIAYEQVVDKPIPAKIKLSAQFTDQTQKRITAKIISDFAVNYEAGANFKIGIVITENKVKGTSSGYAQSNYYANGKNGVMGGYESLPDPVPANKMTYQEVARALFGSFAGFEESISNTIAIGTPIDFTYTFDIPSSVRNIENMELVAILLDGNNQDEIVNADRISTSEITFPTAINEVQLTGLAVRAYKNSSETVAIEIETEKSQTISVEIYGLDAKRVSAISPVTVNGSHRFIVPTHELKGLHLIKVKTDQQVTTTKVLF